MPSLTNTFWPTARQFAEAVQCPPVCFHDPYLKNTQPAIDRLGMPLVTSGQFAYVFKLKAAGRESVAVRCFRGYLGDREERYKSLDEHLNAHRVAALPRFKYQPEGILVGGRRFPVLVMEWVEGTTLDVYLEETFTRREVLLHLADEWVRLMSDMRAAGVAHGDLQHGNIIVEHGQLRLVDLDGMFVPRMKGWTASEVGHQHYQHPARDERFFSADLDNFSALVIYLSLISLAERPELWGEHHDENLIFTKHDFQRPDESALFAKIKELGGEQRRLAEVLEKAARDAPDATPALLDLVSPASNLPSWINAPPDMEVAGRTREVARAEVRPVAPRGERVWARAQSRVTPQPLGSSTVQTIFGASPSGAGSQTLAPLDPRDIRGNTWTFSKRYAKNSLIYFWWLPAHRILSEAWVFFGVLDEAAALLVTVFFIVFGFLAAGFMRALYEAETSPPAPQTAGGYLPHSTPVAPPPQPPRFGVTTHPLAQANPPYASAPSGDPVVGNGSLQIYHQPSCRWVDKISPRHRIQFSTPFAARAAGFRPCRVCAP